VNVGIGVEVAVEVVVGVCVGSTYGTGVKVGVLVGRLFTGVLVAVGKAGGFVSTGVADDFGLLFVGSLVGFGVSVVTAVSVGFGAERPVPGVTVTVAVGEAWLAGP